LIQTFDPPDFAEREGREGDCAGREGDCAEVERPSMSVMPAFGYTKTSPESVKGELVPGTTTLFPSASSNSVACASVLKIVRREI
jgi:hypothetical protein